jgi:hypothetical protein
MALEALTQLLAFLLGFLVVYRTTRPEPYRRRRGE